MSYKQYLYDLPLGAALKAPYGKQHCFGIGQHLDDLLQATKDSVKASWPEYAGAASDAYAVALLGSDAGIRRYSTESTASYAARVWQAFSKWSKAGTTAPITEDLTGIGYSQISYIMNADWAPSPPDGNTTWWSRFWVVIRGHGFTMPTYGGGTTYGGGGLYGGTYTAAQLAEIKAIIKQWKPAHAYCSHVIIAYGNNILPAGKAVAGWVVGNNAAYIPCGF